MKKTIVITGASGEIGSLCAYEAAKRGMQILLCYNTNEKAAQRLKDSLLYLSNDIELIGGDLTKTTDRLKIASFVSERYGGTDILVNNFGRAQIKPFLDTDDKDIAEILDCNLNAHIAFTRLILPPMIKAKSGAIVNISSVWGMSGASCEVLYSAAKAGIIGFTKALAKELAPSNITVNCCAPGIIDSPMLDGLDKEFLCNLVPLERLGSAADVAECVLFLAESDYITGQVLSPNGGLVI